MLNGKLLVSGEIFAESVEFAATLPERLRGLLGRDEMPAGTAMVIDHCGAVHTVGMRFAIDLVFLDRKWQVVKIMKRIRPGRIMVFGGLRSRRVIECACGALALEKLQLGDCIRFVNEPVA